MNAPKQSSPSRPQARDADAPVQAAPRCTRRGLHPAVTACRMLLVLSLLTGLAYPLLVAGIAGLVMPGRASGSMVLVKGQPVGSKLLAQRFAGERYFWPRPSAGDNGTTYATVPSSASNLGPTCANLDALVRVRVDRFRAAHGLSNEATVPSEMVFASGSGLDPHISPASARMQIQRIAQARRFDSRQTERLRRLVEACLEPAQFGFLGEPRVNVLHLNLSLDRLQ